MTNVTLTEAKAHLSALVRRLAAGESILITHRGRPVGRLEPVRGSGRGEAEARRLRLEDAGLLRRGRGKVDLSVLAMPHPRPTPGQSVLAALLKERSEGP